VKKIVALEEQWLACGFRQSVSRTIPKVQPGGVTASTTEIAVNFSRDSGLVNRHRLDADLGFPHQTVEPAAGTPVLQFKASPCS
jgi:hypothetical protein